MEVYGIFAFVHPSDVIVWIFDTMAGVVVVEHNLAGMDFLLLIYLPEDGGIGPAIAGADSVAHHCCIASVKPKCLSSSNSRASLPQMVDHLSEIAHQLS